MLVLDATNGQNALAQIDVFKEVAGVTGLIMTKLDGTARGGVLVAAAARYGAKYLLDPPRPPHWGGLRLVPDRWEFWQGRKSRLHDRLCYRLEDGAWLRERLSP